MLCGVRSADDMPVDRTEGKARRRGTGARSSVTRIGEQEEGVPTRRFEDEAGNMSTVNTQGGRKTAGKDQTPPSERILEHRRDDISHRVAGANTASNYESQQCCRLRLGVESSSGLPHGKLLPKKIRLRSRPRSKFDNRSYKHSSR